MGITNFGTVYSNGSPLIPGGGAMPPYTGNWFYVNATTGADGNSGTADAPLATISAALTKCVAGRHDVVAIQGTIRLSSQVVWNKNETHMVGICAPLKRGKRARISTLSTATPFGKMISVTANGCHFANFQVFSGFAVATTTDMPWEDKGGRNCYDNVEFMGFGDGTVSTGSAVLTTSRALLINTDVGEITFKNCVFGVDTVSRNAANFTVEIAGKAPRITFENCDFESILGSSGAGSSHVLIGATGIDRYASFNRCRFFSATKSSGTAMSQAFNVSATAGGFVFLDQCTIVGITKPETTASNVIFLNNSAVSATAGIAINNT